MDPAWEVVELDRRPALPGPPRDRTAERAAARADRHARLALTLKGWSDGIRTARAKAQTVLFLVATVLLARLWSAVRHSPRGLWAAVRWWGRWVSDREGATACATLAVGDAQAAAKHKTSAERHWRQIWWRLGITALVAAAAVFAVPLLPAWAALALVPLTVLLGLAGRPAYEAEEVDPQRATIGGEEIAAAFARAGELKQWVTDVQDAALKRAYETDGSVPGFKVVRSGGRRSITNPEAAVDTLLELGYPEDKVFSRKPATLGALEKLVGSADELQEVLGGLLVKGEGRLSLVPDSDAREKADAVHSAESDFAEIEIEGDA